MATKKTAKKSVADEFSKKKYIVISANSDRARVCSGSEEINEAIFDAWESGDDIDDILVFEVTKELEVVPEFKIKGE